MNDRRKRVQKLKKMIIIAIAVLLLLPSLLCIILAFKVGKLESQIEELRNEMTTSGKLDDSSDGQAKTDNRNIEDVLEEDGKKIRKVYLTFDDGPSIYTKDILDVLKRYNVKATFFVTGMNAPQYDECLQEILDDGHSLGIHTYSHVYKEIYSSLEMFQDDFNKMRDYIFQKTGEDIKLYRFPGGSANEIVSKRTRKKIFSWLEEEGVLYYDWNVSSGDAESQLLSAEEIADNCINGVKECNTAIVLLHDAAGKKNTVEALPLIIEGINQLDDTILLPMDEETVTIQQIRSTKE